MCEWAQVKYLDENTRAIVRTSFFKVVVNGIRTPADLEVGETYQVFWSCDEEETPMDVINAGNEIIDIDDLPELERRRRRKEGPLKGYYNALLLALSDDEDIERPYKRELSGSNCLPTNVKRTKVPSAKAIEAKKNSEAINQGRGAAKALNLNSSKPSKSLSVEATRRNLSTLFDQVKKKPAGRAAVASASKDQTDPDYVPSPIKSSISRKKDSSARNLLGIKETPQTLIKTMAPPKVDKEKLRKDAERALKKAKEDYEKAMAASLESPEKANKSGPKARDQDFFFEPESPAPENISDSDGFHEFSKIVNKFKHTNEVETGTSSSSKEDTSGKELGDKVLDETTPVDQSDDISDSSSDDDIVMVPRRLKPPAKGPAGDSAALFQCAAQLWKPEELVVRSPTGLPPPTKKGAAPYPKMTPQKVDQCRDFLQKRILTESPNATEEEVDLRLNKVGYILGQKISSTRKSFRAKNISYPSAEEVREERRRKKEEKRRRRMQQ